MIALIYSNNTCANQSRSYHTHNSSLYVPNTVGQMKNLFADKMPKTSGWVCSDVIGGGEPTGIIPTRAAEPKKVRKPDGWGGYVETTEAGDPRQLVERLKELEKEYRK